MSMSKRSGQLLVLAGAAALTALYYVLLRRQVLDVHDTKGEIAAALGLLAVTLVALLCGLGGGIAWLVTHRSRRAAAFARGSLTWSGSAGSLLVLMVVLSQLTAFTPEITEGPDPISELRQIEVDGRTEWLNIRGQDRSNPVILFLAGGPGGSQLATSRHYFAGLEDSYTIVTWEQPGAGKSSGAIAPEEITLDIYVQDGNRVADYLRHEFAQDTVYLIGESWGSALGLLMAHDRPDLYAAFLGTGQMVSFLDTEKMDYDLALADARALGDRETVTGLEEQGPPPYESGVALKTNAYLGHLYGTMERTGDIDAAPVSSMDGFFCVEYGLYDSFTFGWGLYRVFDTFYPQLYPVDLREVAYEQHIPIYIHHGRHDLNAPTVLVEDYLRVLQAPSKELVYYEHSGHNPWQTENQAFLDNVRRRFTATTRLPRDRVRRRDG